MRTAKIENQNMRLAHEMICVENIGSNVNRGPVIPHGTPVRSLAGVLTNNPGYTALSDAEIEFFSRANNGEAIIPGKEEPEYYCQLEFYGNFSLDTICYSIMKPCRCVVEFGENYQTISTAQFTAMHSVTKLISRISSDGFEKGVIYKRANTGEKIVVQEVTDIEIMRNCLKLCEATAMDIPNISRGVISEDDLEEKLAEANRKIDELEERISDLMEEIANKDYILSEIKWLLQE